MPLLRVTQTNSCRSQTAMSRQDKFPFVTETSRYWMRSTSCRFLWRYRPSCGGVGEGGTARRLEQFQALRTNKSSASPVLMNSLIEAVHPDLESGSHCALGRASIHLGRAGQA